MLHAPEEEEGSPALGLQHPKLGWRCWTIGVPLLRMGLTIKAVLHEEVYYFANRVCLDINDSDFEEELNKLAAADVRRRSLRSLCEPSGNITSQLLDGPLRPSKLRSSCNHLPLLPSQVKRDKLERPCSKQPPSDNGRHSQCLMAPLFLPNCPSTAKTTDSSRQRSTKPTK